MSNANEKQSQLADGITLFLTAAGVDLILREGGKQHRCRIEYSSLSGTLTKRPVSIEFTDDDEIIHCILEDESFELRLQPKGHYFSFLDQMPPKSEQINITEARKLFRAAQRAKAKR